MPTANGSVLRRIEKLERQHLWSRGVQLVAVVCAGALLLMGQARTPTRMLEAQGFILRDTNGKKKAGLTMTADGPFLSLYDEKGTERAALGFNGDTPGLALTDSGGKTRLSVSVASTGPAVALVDKQGKERVAIYLTSPGSEPVIELYDENEKVTWTAPGAPSSSPSGASATDNADVCVESYPGDAEVFVDGQAAGQAPLALKLSPGDHLIEAKSPGQTTWSRRIHVLGSSKVVLKAYWKQPIFRPESCWRP